MSETLDYILYPSILIVACIVMLILDLKQKLPIGWWVTYKYYKLNNSEKEKIDKSIIYKTRLVMWIYLICVLAFSDVYCIFFIDNESDIYSLIIGIAMILLMAYAIIVRPLIINNSINKYLHK